VPGEATKDLPGYPNVGQEWTLKILPFGIACKQEGKAPIAILPIDFFYELLKLKLK